MSPGRRPRTALLAALSTSSASRAALLRGVANVRAAVVRWLRACAAADADRAFYWSPAAVALGVGVYFSLKAEPAAASGPAVVAVGVALRLIATSGLARAGAVCLALVGLGFWAADARTDAVGAPQIARELSPRAVVGRLVSVDEGARNRRLVVAPETIRGLDEDALPARIRLTWRGADFDVVPGDRVEIRAGLSPPPPPVAPGAFDFARYLYFMRIGGVGYAVAPPKRLATAQEAGYGPSVRAGSAIEALRTRLARRITSVATSEGGGIVAAVVTGKRGAVTQEAEDALRDSGLAHLLAISGLHMGLATGLIFFGVRAALARAEIVALTQPIKKWAALAALAAGFGYLLLSGGGWSARRAFVMTAIFLIAVLADRRALSLRNVALAALIILITTPEALLHPGFQMSFAAVTALIAGYEWARARDTGSPRYRGDAGPLGRLRRYAVGLAATDTLAAVATAPFALFHFHRTALYSLPANLAAMPVMGFWIMPCAIVGLALTPVGLDAFAWRASAAGMDAVLIVARAVSSAPGAAALAPQWPLAALLILTIGGLWLCVQSAAWRWLGLLSLPIAALWAASVPAPLAFVSRDGTNVGVVVAEGADDAVDADLGADGVGGGEAIPRGVALFTPRRTRFEAGAWRELIGADRAAAPKFADVAACDPLGCVLPGRPVVAVSAAPDGIAEDCARADLVVALYPVTRRQDQACSARLVDRRDAWNDGARAIWRDRKTGSIRIKSVADVRGARPWTQREEPQ